MENKRLFGKTVLVTGGSKGIGRETARIFGAMGAHVFICGRGIESLKRTSESLQEEGLFISAVQTDVSNPEACRRLIEKIEAETGRLDIVINNAGMSSRGTIEETDPAMFRKIVEINLMGAAYITHYAIPLLGKSKGSIMFISSLAALHGLPRTGPYGSSKLALTALSESLRAELHDRDIHVGIVYVGFTRNDPDKICYGGDGSVITLHREQYSQSQQKTAGRIVRCALRGRRRTTLTLLGHASRVFYCFFPRLSDFIAAKIIPKSGRYGDKE